MGAAIGAALMAGAVFLGAAGLRRVGFGTTSSVALALAGAVVLVIGCLWISIKLGY